MSEIAFKTEEFGEALKDFVGQIVATDYALEPFEMKGAPEITRKGKVLCIQVRTDVYDKDQYEWYPPSRVKKTKPVLEPSRRRVTTLFLGFKEHPASEQLSGVKWAYLIEALNAVGAMKDIAIGGANDDERMTSFAKSMLGMKFRWQEQECESLVKERGGAQKKFNLLVPVEYLGKTAIEAAATVRQATIGEAVGEGLPPEV